MYKKIAIVGAPGTGKTTLSNKLSEIFKIPVIHIDGIHHLKNWEIRDKEERDKIILEETSKNCWIIDGTYKHTLRQRFESADLIIWLDFSSIAQVKGVLSRYIKNVGKEKAEIPGCKEKMSLNFLLYVFKYNKTKRNIILEKLDGIDKEKVLVLKNRKEVNSWVSKIQNISIGL